MILRCAPSYSVEAPYSTPAACWNDVATEIEPCICAARGKAHVYCLNLGKSHQSRTLVRSLLQRPAGNFCGWGLELLCLAAALARVAALWNAKPKLPTSTDTGIALTRGVFIRASFPEMIPLTDACYTPKERAPKLYSYTRQLRLLHASRSGKGYPFLPSLHLVHFFPSSTRLGQDPAHPEMQCYPLCLVCVCVCCTPAYFMPGFFFLHYLSGDGDY